MAMLECLKTNLHIAHYNFLILINSLSINASNCLLVISTNYKDSSVN